ncbi:ArsR family transcriptional regulator [Azorhizobium sp. AG788]|uniref:ArsR/SmtB family transcription factor n=1 Tax=Azorhizobium sp. AG788 TaxID=2183897 RepID=UPI00105D98FE|nr:helix-turn-helix transcriptional regulator [Azorhizobium sp. AG788]TDT92871.1 ArsR family transcriptional regulator [Azorhizobium sp. AG788]
MDADLWHPETDELDLSRVLAALADPHRRRVVLQLARADGPYLCASFCLPVAKATRTHHFRVLREAGLIRQVDLGNGRSNTLRRADLDARFPGLMEALLAAEPEGPAAAEAQMLASPSGGASTPAPAR